jgi:hypothetical protein
MVIAALGLYSLSGLDASSSAWDIIWRLCITGLGMGMFQSPNNSAIMGSVPPWHLGIASGILAAMRNVGMVLGIAVAGAVLANIAPITQGGGPTQDLSGLHWAFIAGAGLAGLAALTSLLAVEKQATKTEEA